jgi:hypothetical protein
MYPCEQKKGVNLRPYSAYRGTAKHLKPTEIAKGTHPLGAPAKAISLVSKNWRFSTGEILATQYFIDV